MANADKIIELFYTPYPVMVTEKAMLAMRGDDGNGRVTSGSVEDDLAVLDVSCKRMLPICPRDDKPASILLAMEQGIGPIRLCNPDQIITIYEDVEAHVNAWLYGDEAFWRAHKPMDDLIRMAAFLDAIQVQYQRKKGNFSISPNLAFSAVGTGNGLDSIEKAILERQYTMNRTDAAKKEAVPDKAPTRLLDDLLKTVFSEG